MASEISTATDIFFLLFWTIFCPFTPIPQQPKKRKKHLEISSIYTSALKTMIIGYTVPEIWHMTDIIDKIFQFGLFFAFLPS